MQVPYSADLAGFNMIVIKYGEPAKQIISGAAVVQVAGSTEGIAILKAGDIAIPAAASVLQIHEIGIATYIDIPPAELVSQRESIAQWFSSLGDSFRRLQIDNTISLNAQEGIEFANSTTVEYEAAAAATQEYVIAIQQARKLRDDQREAELELDLSYPMEQDREALATVFSAIPAIVKESHSVEIAGIRRVGDQLGVELTSSAIRASSKTERSLEWLSSVIAESGRVTRQVTLDGKWWTSLATVTAVIYDGQIAVAEPGIFASKIHDPETGKTIRINRNIASKVSRTGLIVIPELPKSASLRDLFKVSILGSKTDFAAICVLALVSGLLAAFVPLSVGIIFSEIIPGSQYGRMLALVVAMVSLGLGTFSMSLIQGFLSSRIRTRADFLSADSLWLRIVRLPVSFFGRYSSGDILNRAGSVENIREIVGTIFLATISALVSGVVSILVLFKDGVAIGVLGLFVILLEVLVVSVFLVRRFRLVRVQVETQRRFLTVGRETISGIDRVRVFAAEERFMLKISRDFAGWIRASYQEAREVSLLTAIVSSWSALAILAITASIMFYAEAPIALGAYAVLTTAMGQALASTNQLVAAVESLALTKPWLEELQPILATEPEITQTANKKIDLTGEITLEHVNFSYRPDLPAVLEDFNLRIRVGESVAIVGPSGAGKSTILRLLLAFDLPTEGQVTYNGQDLGGLDRTHIRRQIGTVLQQSELFPGTLADNIRGSSQANQSEIEQAAELAGIATDISQMPMKYQTLVGHGTSTLSGGQQQRILIARALVRSPKILLFDEATSALDNITQKHVADSLAGLDITRVVIAHRLSSIRSVDRVIVLDKGRIVEQGSFAELIDAGGLFTDLARKQQLE